MVSINLRRLCGTAALILALAAPHAASAQYTYTITDLGTLGGSNSYGNAINASGQVAGGSFLAGDTVFHATRWIGTTAQELCTLGGTTSQGSSINASGQVAGYSSLAGDAAQHAVRWTVTSAQDLGTLGGTYSFGYGINASGQVTGDAKTARNAADHAVRWTGTAAEDLGTLGGTVSVGLSINDSGQIAGDASLSGNNTFHAVRWTGTVAEDLGTLGGSSSYGNVINASGQVAGSSDTTGDAAQHATRWTGTSAQDLGTLGGTYSEGYGIDSFGTVVGISDLASGGSHAFYTVGNTMHDLNELLPTGSGWVLTSAAAINDTFQITGSGTINGSLHAFLLTRILPSAVGRIALAGIADLNAVDVATPLSTFRFGFRTPGTVNEVYRADVKVTTTPGSPWGTFTVSDIPPGVYDVSLITAFHLRTVLPNITVNGVITLPDVTLRSGDSDGDGVVDIVDFGILVNTYGQASDP